MTLPSNREKYAGNSRYKSTRAQNYDMQRDFGGGKFDELPSPEKVNTDRYEHGNIGGGGYGGEKSPDPILDHLKGIRDDSTPNTKEMKTNG